MFAVNMKNILFCLLLQIFVVIFLSVTAMVSLQTPFLYAKQPKFIQPLTPKLLTIPADLLWTPAFVPHPSWIYSRQELSGDW